MARSVETQRPWWKRIGYFICWSWLRGSFVSLTQLRVSDSRRMPQRGGVLVCSNHQSHFDPALVGLVLPRRMNYLARRTLFQVPVLGWLIAYLDAIPIERDGMGIGGIKETLRRLKRGEMVLIFPEGTRSPDGHIQPLRPGFYSIARRSQCPILPVGIAGAYQMWPRHKAVPTLGRTAVAVGEPIEPELIAQLDEQGLIQELDARIRACHVKACAMLGLNP